MNTFIGLLLTLFSFNALAADSSITLITPTAKKSFSVSELKSKLEVVHITIDDPVYGKSKSYDGFRLNEVAKLLPNTDTSASAATDEIVFTALDGYAPTLPMKEFQAHEPILAYSEQGKSGFDKVAQGKTMIDPGPFYVIWADAKKVGTEFPWPYQLASIEWVSFKSKFPKLYPLHSSEKSKEMKGFLTFKAQCVRCHSINLEGGELAPELNIPKNITEYWQPNVLHAFIQDASQFRLKSKMPSFKKVLSSENVDELITYLKAMKKNKILPKE